MDLFERKNNSQASSRIKEWARAVFAADEDTTIMVSELTCTEPGCPPLETVIAILASNGNRQYKIHSAMADVTEEQVLRFVHEQRDHVE